MQQSPKKVDLNKIRINADGAPVSQTDFGCLSGNVQVFFKDLQPNLISKINTADIVVGCVAWLTDFPILAALSQRRAVSIVVQKEDFLRPDIDTKNINQWRDDLQRAYRKLPGSNRYMFEGTLAPSLSFASDPDMTAVRCVGYARTNQAESYPRMHHKFVALCRYEMQSIVVPYAVWTGSFNFTKAAAQSFENALYIEDSTIASAYCNEWAQVLAFSESLDWTTTWSAPEYRIGT